MLEHFTLILAEDPPVGSQEQPPSESTQQPSGDGETPLTNKDGAPSSIMDNSFIFLILGMFVLMMIFTTGSQRKQRKRRAALLASIKKGDKVVTRGGIIGSVVELRDNEVMLKIDENANTRVKFDRSAIETVREDTSD